jgi:hypothetical protein
LVTQTAAPKLLRRQVALPQDHGSWVFILSPLIIGLFAGNKLTLGSFILIVGVMAAFLSRQPVTMLVKVYSGRRNRRDLSAAVFWAAIYLSISLIAVISLVYLGYGYILLLAIPGVPVFVWHLVLVSRRSERRQMGVEIVASGVLALAAPAAYWIGIGHYDPSGWWLFLLIWFQSAASIVYAYLRLEQRELRALPDLRARFAMGRLALGYTSINLIAVTALAIAGVLPVLLPIPYLLQWGETLWGISHPALGWKPVQIGTRQLIISTLFTILFILTWTG